MQLTNKAKLVDRKPLSIAEKIYLPAIIKGMGITGKHAIMTLTGKLPTVSYPEEQREFSKIYRGLHVLKRDDEGRENNDVNDPLLLLTNDESKRRREPSLEAQVHTIMSTGIIMEN